jgi:tetratricopeptide (TPR) repeat protein
LNIASFLAEGNGRGRWELFPGRTPGEKERELIARILPLLKTGAESGDRRDEAMFLLATLQIMTGDVEGGTTARDFLRKFPASSFAGDLAVRLGHEALLAGKTAEAVGFYRLAAESSRRESSDVARYMLGWARFQTGDSAEAARELSVPLSDPSFPCDQPSPFERALVSLAVRVWRDTPLEKLRSYPPVREGACSGKLLLTSLGEEEEKRGEASRAAAVYDALAMEFPGDEAAPSYEKHVVENLLRAGKEDQAFSRALTLGEKYGPGSLWAKNQKPSVRENAWKELSAIVKNLSEQKFEEGIRSGESKTISDAKAGIEKYFAGKEEGRAGKDPEMQLKWAIASLKTGDRKTGVSVLHDLAQQRSDSLGEQAAILYAETMIAGYERKEETAENAENAAILLLDKLPTEKGSALAYRAAAALLKAGEYDRSVHTAEKIIQNQATPKPLLLDARLVRAEASIYLNKLDAARAEADSILGEASGKDATRARERARDLYLLSSLKQAEEKTAAKDYIGAARIFEELGGRFPEIPDAPSYFLRAVRSYVLGQDSDGAIRVGSEFLDKFPRREEAFEIVNTVSPLLIAKDKYTQAADVYAKVAERFPKNEQASGFLFRAAQLNADHGRPGIAITQFLSYRGKYSNPHWMTVYATLSAGVLAWKSGDTKTGIREIEAGIRQMEAGVEEDAPKEFFALGGRARIIFGEYWGDQFRKVKLVIPLEKSLAIKDRFFRRALGSFSKAKDESPIEVALEASQMAGDLFVDFGKSILNSQRPKGLRGENLEKYQEELKARARTFFEESEAWYLGALDRLEAEGGPSNMAVPIRQRLEAAQELLSGLLGSSGGR